MAKRQIITIDEDKCNGCGLCVTGCHEGALQIVNGKAKLVNESFCDGFGDCIGECPTGALVIEEREAKEFDLDATAEHVRTLRGDEAVEEMMKAQEVHEAKEEAPKHNHGGGCPGSRMRVMKKPSGGCPGSQAKSLKKNDNNGDSDVEVQSTLQQWPVQISLLSPFAPYFKNADLLITADCVPFAYGDYHRKLLKGKAVAIGCPKLDDGDAYVDKLATIIANNDLKSITVARMEVPCCGGMVRITEEAVKRSGVDIEVEIVTIGINGELK
ncbi:4Fe-4S binding protein [Orenia metallireducens]|jgi:Pyruvate/2-oxoacid:ferredoxin oxidoreductase delta subunit|uniref:4Fe-4S binding domain-containing protein n=1 Tax=Orenia metallireducens TaxID=1413210 RepID=A0A285I9C8_9FIRM|nr:4Fe-4S binding protein [Orenia metallireducens]PRX22475.1 4Fe-4S binding protein [Orenia metallireducens]SNY43666.1 4Fe-4S binding domain-containing protein [Orenia metallireducens]